MVSVVVGARLMRGCAFVGARACRHRYRVFHVKQCAGGNGFEPGLGRLCGRCVVLLLLLWCEWWSNEVGAAVSRETHACGAGACSCYGIEVPDLARFYES